MTNGLNFIIKYSFEFIFDSEADNFFFPGAFLSDRLSAGEKFSS